MFVRNDDEFGHGFSLCGCLMMQFLRQRDHFELLDYSNYVLGLYNYECKVRAEPNNDVGSTRFAEKRDKFVVAATFEKLVHMEAFSVFEALNSTSYGLKGRAIVNFKPPTTDY